MTSTSLFRDHVLNHKIKYIFGIALLSISSVLQLYIPQLLKSFTDGLQKLTITIQDTFHFGLWITAVGLGVAFFRSTSRIYIFQLSRQLEKKVRRRLFEHWEKLPAEYYQKQRIGDLMAHAINDVNVIREVAMGGVFLTFEALILITITVIAMSVTINFWLTLLVVLPLPALSYLAYKFRFQIQERSRNVQEAIGILTSRVQEFCSGINVIKAYVQEKEETRKFKQDNKHNIEVNKELIRSNSLFTSVSQGIVGLSYLLSVVFGGFMVMKGTISLGEFVAFNSYLFFLIQPVENLGRVINTLQRGKAADIRLRHILATEPAIKDEHDTLPIHSMSGEIKINNLTFYYPEHDEPVLRHIDLHVPKGSSLAIVGKVGSGKTTLVNLLLRTYNPPRGSIFIDGHDIYQIPLQTLRRSIGYVPQENFLFSSTISNNVAFHPVSYQEKEIHNAAKLAQVYDNIVEFPQKFETPLGERGISLSGGQRQRVSIARALIKESSILILDDTLSAVDAETEEKILHGLKHSMKDKTTIIISHRISSVQHADQIIVLDQGSILEQGNHHSLIQQEGIYAHMHDSQSLKGEMSSITYESNPNYRERKKL